MFPAKIKNIAFLAIMQTVLFYGCEKEPKSLDADPNLSNKYDMISQAASDYDIDKNVLLSAAWLQSNFAINNGKLPKVNRVPTLGLLDTTVPPGQINDLYINAKTLALSMREKLRLMKNVDKFDELRVAAESIIGNNMDTDLRTEEVAKAMLLEEFIYVNNNGFTAILPNNEIINVPPALPENQIEVGKLKRIQQYYLGSFMDEQELLSKSVKVNGNGLAVAANRENIVIPKIVLRWCPGSALQCFEYLRNTSDNATHLLAFKGRNGTRKFVRFFPLEKDLFWDGNVNKNVISITISGHAGTKADNYRPEWLDWNDYASLAKALQFPLTENRDKINQENIIQQPEELNTDKLSFAMPMFWDNKFFRELLTMEDVGNNQVQIESPKIGEQVLSNTVNLSISILPGRSCDNIEVYEDLFEEPDPTPWKQTLKTGCDLDDSAHFITNLVFRKQGITKDTTRAVKVIARDSADKVIGYEVIRFRVPSLKAISPKTPVPTPISVYK